MNIGQKILELRKQKNIKQEELAAELGVTAAAVSKWENGYTLPDIMMLCALADYFEVTTDELLGRAMPLKYAVIAASSAEFGLEIQKMAKEYGFVAKQIFDNLPDAKEFTLADKTVTHLFASFDAPLPEAQKEDWPDGLHFIEVQAPGKQQVLSGFELYFQNMSAYEAIANQAKQTKNKD